MKNLLYRVWKWDGSVNYVAHLSNNEVINLRYQGLYVIPL